MLRPTIYRPSSLLRALDVSRADAAELEPTKPVAKSTPDREPARDRERLDTAVPFSEALATCLPC